MDKQRMIRVGAIVAVAGATGFVMQHQAEPKRTAPQVMTQASPSAQTFAPPARIESIELAAGQLPEVTPSGALPSAAPGLANSPPPMTAPTPDAAAQAGSAEIACTVDIALIAQPGAMIDMGMLAPCRPNERVLVRHAGLVVTGVTSAAGTMVATLPALSKNAEVVVTFPDGVSVTQTASVPDLADFDRFAVQWSESDAFQLHAFADGAKSGDSGHISAASPRRAQPEGGFLTLIGDSQAPRPLLAEVFTWPKGTPALSGAFDLTIEAAITPQTCNREILGETLQFIGGKTLTRDLTIAMPSCEFVGEFVALQNPVMPEKLASN